MRLRSVAIALGLLLALGLAALFLRVGSVETFKLLNLSALGSASLGTEAPADAVGGTPGEVLSAERFTHPELGFSFEIPPGASVKSFQDDGGEAVLIEGSAGTFKPLNFQIFIAPFDEPGPITIERIRQDLPGLAIQNPRRATLDGIPALAFSGRDPSLGELSEVWLAHQGHLYQITAPAGFTEQLSEILATWQFP